MVSVPTTGRDPIAPVRAGTSGRRTRVPRLRALPWAAAGAVLAMALLAGSLWWHGVWPGRLSVATVRAAVAGPRVVAITVDDGPSALYTPRVLALLKRHNATATFFVIGKLAQQRPDLVLAEVAQGCTIGTHTWSHPRMDRVGVVWGRAEVTRGMQAVELITGDRPRFYRPPRGVMTAIQQQAASAMGMRVVLWDQCLDHEGDTSPSAAASRVLAHIAPGDIILLHDGAGDREKTVKALAILLDGLAAAGYRVVPLGQLPI